MLLRTPEALTVEFVDRSRADSVSVSTEEDYSSRWLRYKGGVKIIKRATKCWLITIGFYARPSVNSFPN